MIGAERKNAERWGFVPNENSQVSVGERWRPAKGAGFPARAEQGTPTTSTEASPVAFAPATAATATPDPSVATPRAHRRAATGYGPHRRTGVRRTNRIDQPKAQAVFSRVRLAFRTRALKRCPGGIVPEPGSFRSFRR